MQEYICRFPEEDTHHVPPYPNLGALPSHVRPHFVVFNTGLKLQALGGAKFQLLDMMRNIVPRLDEAVEMLLIIESLYRMWTEVEIPPNLFSYPSHSPQSHHPEARQGSPSGSVSRPKRRRVERPESDTQGSHHSGRQHRLEASSSACIHTWRVATEGLKDQLEHTCTPSSSEDWTVTTP
ncbi:hypothetical protein JVT61DRAFT_9399 [Boletus reticuloceps]|uniref:Uncharacterized protein n=1 Tax=Boletus reticuloceps TaxID=495285 RepID=A0A8I2YHY9_9AGAM|nr:hypothetical protein JVT61DRAFT_9399 [Boletus reticuloceps]